MKDLNMLLADKIMKWKWKSGRWLFNGVEVPEMYNMGMWDFKPFTNLIHTMMCVNKMIENGWRVEIECSEGHTDWTVQFSKLGIHPDWGMSECLSEAMCKGIKGTLK